MLFFSYPHSTSFSTFSDALLGVEAKRKAQIMTTEDIIIPIFDRVDNGGGQIAKDPCAKLYASAVVTIGILLDLKGGHFRGFYRWLKRDFDKVFGGLADRNNLVRQL